MEVRSNNEKCGNDAVAATTTTIIQHSKSLESIVSQDANELDLTKITLNNGSTPMTKDESEYFS